RDHSGGSSREPVHQSNNLGVGLTEKKLAVLAEARLDHVQIPIQDADAASADRMADCEGGYARKRGSCE
ncbi:MAG: hypothetical protein WBO12_10900, partial [Xanthobacteraceae bacterium]